jgi:hypothetical protein
LLTEASNHEATANWGSAEVAYRKELERAITAGEATSQYKAYASLSRLSQLEGDHTTALKQSQRATIAAREADLPMLLAMALEQEAGCALRLKRLSESLSAVEEALRLMTDEKLYDLERGRCLIIRAECKINLGTNSAAESDLNASWQLLRAQAPMWWAAGVHSAQARWWSASAALRAGQGDWCGALQAWENAVAQRRHVARLPQVAGPFAENALAEALAAYGQGLLRAGNREAAATVLAEKDAIRQTIGLA